MQDKQDLSETIQTLGLTHANIFLFIDRHTNIFFFFTSHTWEKETKGPHPKKKEETESLINRAWPRRVKLRARHAQHAVYIYIN